LAPAPAPQVIHPVALRGQLELPLELDLAERSDPRGKLRHRVRVDVVLVSRIRVFVPVAKVPGIAAQKGVRGILVGPDHPVVLTGVRVQHGLFTAHDRQGVGFVVAVLHEAVRVGRPFPDHVHVVERVLHRSASSLNLRFSRHEEHVREAHGRIVDAGAREEAGGVEADVRVSLPPDVFLRVERPGVVESTTVVPLARVRAEVKIRNAPASHRPVETRIEARIRGRRKLLVGRDVGRVLIALQDGVHVVERLCKPVGSRQALIGRLEGVDQVVRGLEEAAALEGRHGMGIVQHVSRPGIGVGARAVIARHFDRKDDLAPVLVLSRRVEVVVVLLLEFIIHTRRGGPIFDHVGEVPQSIPPLFLIQMRLCQVGLSRPLICPGWVRHHRREVVHGKLQITLDLRPDDLLLHVVRLIDIFRFLGNQRGIPEVFLQIKVEVGPEEPCLRLDSGSVLLRNLLDLIQSSEHRVGPRDPL